MPARTKNDPTDISKQAPAEEDKPFSHAHSVSSKADGDRMTFAVPKTATFAIIGLFALGIAFFAGDAYGHSRNTSTVTSTNGDASTTSNDGQAGGGFGGFGNFANRGAFGQVASVNGDNFTVTGRDGRTTAVETSSSTTYSGGSSVSVGQTVLVKGSRSSSGTLNATSVAINPSFPFGGSSDSNSNSNSASNSTSNSTGTNLN